MQRRVQHPATRTFQFPWSSRLRSWVTTPLIPNITCRQSYLQGNNRRRGSAKLAIKINRDLKKVEAFLKESHPWGTGKDSLGGKSNAGVSQVAQLLTQIEQVKEVIEGPLPRVPTPKPTPKPPRAAKRDPALPPASVVNSTTLSTSMMEESLIGGVGHRQVL